jgi:hypothetical protein
MRAIDLAVRAGRKRQSPRTGFVHYYPGFDGFTDTIPVYENFCFALALFRLKTAEGVNEGKEIIDRLLAFRVDGNFPIYLHEYPKTWDFKLDQKIAPILRQILRDFSTVLNSSFKEKLSAGLEQIQDQESGTGPLLYNKQLQLVLSDHRVHEKGEPQPLPIEYLLGEKEGLKGRLIQDHIHQLYSITQSSLSITEIDQPYSWQKNRLYWKGETLHSLYGLNEGETLFHLPEGIEIGKDDIFEILTYCDISPETHLSINGQKGMVFCLGDMLRIHTPVLTIALQFELIEGIGDFCGHISRANRPDQIANQGVNQYEAYDWQIGLRTLRRNGACKIRCISKIILN